MRQETFLMENEKQSSKIEIVGGKRDLVLIGGELARPKVQPSKMLPSQGSIQIDDQPALVGITLANPTPNPEKLKDPTAFAAFCEAQEAVAEEFHRIAHAATEEGKRREAVFEALAEANLKAERPQDRKEKIPSDARLRQDASLTGNAARVAEMNRTLDKQSRDLLTSVEDLQRQEQAAFEKRCAHLFAKQMAERRSQSASLTQIPPGSLVINSHGQSVTHRVGAIR